MPDRVVPGPVGNTASIREAVSINTNKIFDCCRDKDCIDELRVYPTLTSQTYLDNPLLSPPCLPRGGGGARARLCILAGRSLRCRALRTRKTDP